MTHRSLLCALMVFAAACNSTDGIDEVTSTSWAGEVKVTENMLIMTLAERGTTLSGSGGFSALSVAGSSDPFTISGTRRVSSSGNRRADTLDMVFKRRTGAPVRFVGSFPYSIPNVEDVVLIGTLTGGEYYGTPVTLVKQR